MEDTVSVLSWDCWLWDEAMDITDCARLLLKGSSGEVMVEDSGVPVQEDWSMAPDEERVRFSLSGVAPHSSGSWGVFFRGVRISASLNDFSISSSCSTEEFWEIDLEILFFSFRAWLPQRC